MPLECCGGADELFGDSNDLEEFLLTMISFYSRLALLWLIFEFFVVWGKTPMALGIMPDPSLLCWISCCDIACGEVTMF